MSQDAVAEFLGVSLRTVRYWEAGRSRVPWSAVKLLRLRRAGDLGALDDRWAGWKLHQRTAELVSPNGYTFAPNRLAKWTVTCEQSRFWQDAYERWSLGGVGAQPPRGREAVTPLTSALAEARAIGTRPAPFQAAFALPATPPTAFLVVGWQVPARPVGDVIVQDGMRLGAAAASEASRGEAVPAELDPYTTSQSGGG